MPDPSASGELATAGVVGGVVTALGMIGAAIRWLFLWGDKRTERLAREEDELDESWSAYRKRLEARLERAEKREEARDKQVTALRLAFELVAGELRRVAPLSGALRRAEQILAAAFPLEPIVPPEMGEALQKIEDAT